MSRAERGDLMLVVDVETTSLCPITGQIWVAAAILYDRRERRARLEVAWQLPVRLDDPEDFDPESLAIGRFAERRLPAEELADPAVFAQDFARLSKGLPIVGANPSFDTERLARLLRRFDEEPAWHYRPVDVEALAVGFLHGQAAGRNALAHPGSSSAGRVPEAADRLPWGSTEVARVLGIERPGEEAHTALGDCRWELAIWRAVCER